MTTSPSSDGGGHAPVTESEADADPCADRPPQLRRSGIIAIWCAAAIPMPVLAFVVAPALAATTGWLPGIALLVCMIVGMAWQFALAAWLLRRERKAAGAQAGWRERIWWRTPVDPRTGRRRRRLLLVLIPIILGTLLIEESGVADAIAAPLLSLAPWLGDIPAPNIRELADPALHGAWWLVPLMATACLFNYALGEALLFHGYLLPRMRGAFGSRDWLWNGVLFGAYHLIRPLTIPSIMVTGALWAYASIRYRSSQIAILAHASDAVFVVILTLAVVTGKLP